MAKIADEMLEYYTKVKEYFDTLIVGEENAKNIIIASLLCDKNCRILISGKPGTGKSTISDSLAKNFKSRKISITSDLLPSDLLSIIMDCEDLELLQLEEINRTSPKVQSSLIEALGSNTITTTEGVKVLKPFCAIATQNDTEISGIFDTPQAIFDRFDVNVLFGNLSYDELEQVLFEFKRKVAEASFNLRDLVNKTSKIIEEFEYSKIDRYVIMQATEKLKDAKSYGKDLFGSSNIRGHYFMIKLATFHALIEGNTFIEASDIADYISCVYQHRIDHSIMKMNSPEAIEEINKLKKKVLSIQRPNRLSDKKWEENLKLKIK